MRLLIFNHLQNAKQSLRTHRLRSVLTIVGITIGIASITTILALGAGASRIVSEQVQALGGNIAVVRPGTQETLSVNSINAVQGQRNYAASTLTNTDVIHLQAIPNVTLVAPIMILSGAIKGNDLAPGSAQIVASTPDLADISRLAIKDGQFLDPSLDPDTAVVGPQLATEVFGTEYAIGKSISIRGKPFTIIGVLERTNDPINYNGVDFDNAVIIHQDSGAALNGGVSQIQQINIKTTNIEQLESVIIQANKTLLKTHLGEKDFTVLSGEQIAQPTNQLFYAVAAVTAAIAAISLIVGGIGVMNIMLVSVVERTREIGIRKAVGASNGDIVGQFLIESLVLSIGGGAAGYILGYVIAFIVSTFLTFDPVFTWEILLIAVGTSLVIGLLFGLYPAVRAARKDPISALRQYD